MEQSSNTEATVVDIVEAMAEATDKAAKKAARQHTVFKSWYEKNKEKLSAIRKAKYDSDPEYRAKIKVHADIYRLNRPKKIRKKSEKVTIPMLCEQANCSVHTFRKYVHQGWIPKGSIHISFTDKHVKLLSDLAKAAIEATYIRKDRISHIQPYIDAIAANWN